MKSSPAAIELIHRFEGFDQPWIWQGGMSGVTIGYGYDLGYELSFMHDWCGLLNVVDMSRLNAAVGIKGEPAHSLCQHFQTIKIPEHAASLVFQNTTLPKYENLVIQTFPQSEKLPADAFGALVSLIYNRGTSLVDAAGSDRRAEMRNIYLLLKGWDGYNALILRNLATQVDSMKRLWPNIPDDDCSLHNRREAEASLIRNAQFATTAKV